MSKKMIEDMARDMDELLTEKPEETSKHHLNMAAYLCGKGWHKQSEGKWIYHECVSSYDGAKSGCSCSNCNAFVDEDVFFSYEFHKDFCGSCGAKMKTDFANAEKGDN